MTQTAFTLDGERDALEAFAAGFDARYGDEGFPASLFEAEPDRAVGSRWRFSVYVPSADADEWHDRLVLMARERELSDDWERLDFGETDWVAETLRALSPVRAGRFLVHGTHDRGAVRASDVAIELDAGLAFGTGHHGTTAGCLRMLDRALRRSRPLRVMDIGTGSGVLAIAAAKAARVPVLATDIDPVAVRVARENGAANGVVVRCECAPGFHSPAFARFGPGRPPARQHPGRSAQAARATDARAPRARRDSDPIGPSAAPTSGDRRILRFARHPLAAGSRGERLANARHAGLRPVLETEEPETEKAAPSPMWRGTAFLSVPRPL